MHLLLARRRRRSALAVGTAGVVLVLVAACASSPKSVPSGSFASTITVSGRVLPYDGVQRWSVASVPARGSEALTVFATGAEDGGGPCGPPVVKLEVRESATSIRVVAVDYQQPSDSVAACPAIGYIPSAHRVHLTRAVGDRTIIDGSDSHRHALLVGTDYPRLTTVPTGFVSTPLGRDGSGAAAQSWFDHGEFALALGTTRPAATREFGTYGRIVRQLDIGGAPATVYRGGTGRYGQMSVRWTPNSAQTITLGLNNTGRTRWTIDRAVALARAVAGYRSADTGRLRQPSTPGTAAASYNSADGPVVHASNLLKSSGVFVGVDCRGSGRVVVSLRGSSYRFDCTSRLTHHLAESMGKPYEEFFLDVRATTGVRWAITLARASLDGT